MSVLFLSGASNITERKRERKRQGRIMYTLYVYVSMHLSVQACAAKLGYRSKKGVSLGWAEPAYWAVVLQCAVASCCSVCVGAAEASSQAWFGVDGYKRQE